MLTIAALAVVLMQQPGISPRPFTALLVVYPELLRQARLEGRVVTRILVDTSGRVVAESVRVLSSTNAGFDLPLKRAASAWFFQRPAGTSGHVPVTIEVLFLTTSATILRSTYTASCDHCDRETDALRRAVVDRARSLSTCSRLLERWSNVSELQPLSDSLLSVLLCREAPVIAPLVIRAMGRGWDGDTARVPTVATMGYRFRTADALLAAARVAEDSSLPVAGRVYGFQVLSVLVHPNWVWRLSPDAESGCDRILVFSAPPDDWGESWPIEAKTHARGVAERTLARRGAPGPVRAAASCLLDLLR